MKDLKFQTAFIQIVHSNAVQLLLFWYESKDEEGTLNPRQLKPRVQELGMEDTDISKKTWR